MNNQDSGHKGGVATRDNHITLCPCCGKPTKSEFFSEIGRKGGEAVRDKYGPELYRNNGRYSGRGITKEKRIAKFGYDPLAKKTSAAESSEHKIQEGLGVSLPLALGVKG